MEGCGQGDATGCQEATTGDADVSGDMRSSVSPLHSFCLRTQAKGIITCVTPQLHM